jgi:non-ribosomal peptide synthase protein (TIGR01720 family)
MLVKHPGVKEAVVVVKQEPGMEKRLAAYVVGQGQEGVTGEELRKFLRQRLPEYMVPAVIERLEEMPLNANGKVNRQELASSEIRVDAGEGHEEPEGEVEKELARIWAEVLRVKRVGAQQSFFELGGDSILAIQISARAKQAGLQVKPRQIFEQRTLRGVAQAIGQEKQTMAEQQAVVGEAPLTPIQHWFFDQQLKDSHHSNMPMLMGANRPLEAELLRQAVGALLKQHDALRMRYRKEGEQWRQSCGMPEEQVPFEVVDLREVEGEEERLKRLEEHATGLQGSLDLESGPIVRVALYEMGGSQRVLMVIHHLAVDMVSWRMLLEDLWKAYEQLGRGEGVKLGEKTTSYKEWAEKVEKLANTEELEREVEYWEGEQEGVDGGIAVESAGENSEQSVDVVEVELTEGETGKLLREVARQYRVSASEVMIASLGRALRRWSGKQQVVVDVEGHGREESEVEGVNLTRTVGWFTAIYPVVLGGKAGAEEPGIEELRRVKEQLRRVPRGGIGYGLLKYVNRKPEIRERMKRLAPAQVCFNYLGQLDTLFFPTSSFDPAEEPGGKTIGARETRNYLIEISAFVLRRRLRLSWTFSRNRHSRKTIESVAESYLADIRGFIDWCVTQKLPDYLAEDFSEAGLSQAGLDEVIAKLGPSLK